MWPHSALRLQKRLWQQNSNSKRNIYLTNYSIFLMQFSLQICVINILYNTQSTIFKFLPNKLILATISLKTGTRDRLSWIKMVDFFYLKVWTYPLLLDINSCLQISNFYACRQKIYNVTLSQRTLTSSRIYLQN